MNERGFYHQDLGLIGDPTRKIGLKNYKEKDDRETFYIVEDMHENRTTFFKVLSKYRPPEQVTCAMWPERVRLKLRPRPTRLVS